MKNIYKIFVFLISIACFSCDPMEDTYNELGIEEGELVLEKTVAYTLDDSDYEYFESKPDKDSLVATNLLFEDIEQAGRLIPEILASEFVYLAKGSVAEVTFEVEGGQSEVSSYTGAETLWIGSEELEVVSEEAAVAGFLSPAYDLDESLVSILENEVQDPSEGDVYAVSYSYAGQDPIVDLDAAGLNTIYSEGFADNIDAFNAISLLNDDLVWEYNTFFNGCAIMSAYSGSTQEVNDWLISPAIDLSGVTGSELQFHQVINYLGTGIDPASVLGVKISTDFDGADVASATWTDLVVDVWPAGNSWSEEVWSTIDISTYDESTVYVAFVYDNTTVLDDPSWEVGEVLVEGTTSATVEVVEEPVSYTSYYTYSGGSWSLNEGVYSLTSVDYNSMGEASGQPGRYDNFDSGTHPDNYLPTYLASKYPYAQDMDEIIIMYKYYSGSTNVRGDYYIYQDGAWGRIEESLKFGLVDEWVVDPTIKHEFSDADYISMAALWEDRNSEGAASMNSYKNFDLSLWSNDQIIEAVIEYTLVLYPNPDVDQPFLMTYHTWEPGDGEYDVRFVYDGTTLVEVAE
ncbi:DUF5017 domain-containing protein [Gilvimarinus agarilyticus]|uniref:DUF5017 domain-containing protein n=1 Tax=Reichenbachiella agariperforans TaxID=156994 RepID=A0A1M6KFY9_REIAG|nr:choice-of-anchor J domain-containing protein [Reichenbachiella agariperforans]MBU2886052.1 DUF5017 domain-containing protein [Gilvimarinus agarilyticus]MBU2913543.1 DUF5017 domain-containing protein [Reichenbachiella agariperforans]SHJ57838.1 hypothetical protein SAMN04488028_101562 [Reichenbachiella agariperforans]